VTIQALEWTRESVHSQEIGKQVKQVEPGPVLKSVLKVCQLTLKTQGSHNWWDFNVYKWANEIAIKDSGVFNLPRAVHKATFSAIWLAKVIRRDREQFFFDTVFINVWPVIILQILSAWYSEISFG